MVKWYAKYLHNTCAIYIYKCFTADGLNNRAVFIPIDFTEKYFSVDVPTIISNKEIMSY